MRSMTDILEILIDPEFKSADVVRGKVRAFLSDWSGGSCEDQVDDFCLLTSELLNNAIEHGGCNSIRCTLRLDGEDAIFSLFSDGTLFDPTAVEACMPVFNSGGELPEGGYGLAIINRLADGFTYRCVDGMNLTVVSKRFVNRVNGGNNGNFS